MDRLGPGDASESLQVAQLSSNLASLNISGTQPALPAFGPQSTGSEFADLSHPEQLDARSAQAMNLARALAAKLQRHLRKNAADYHREAINNFIVPYEQIPGHSLALVRSLSLKPDGKQRARERGAREVEGNVLTLEMTQQLINLAYRHVPHNTDLGFRLITEIVLLRLAAVLRNDNTERICLHTDCPIRAVPLPDEDPCHSFGGVVDYVLAKYSAPPPILGPEDVADSEAPRFQQLGAANIFHASSVAELMHGLPQCVLTTASWCLQPGGEEAMRGAATNGEYWIFFAYKRSAEKSHYARSDRFHVRTAEDLHCVDWILGVLIDWIENTGDCDAFEYFEDPEYDLPAGP